MNRLLCTLVLACLSLVAITPRAHALEGDTVRLFFMGELGLAGSMSNPYLSSNLAMGPSYGAAAGFDIGVHDLIALGVMGRMLSIKLQQDIINDIMNGAVNMATQNGSVDSTSVATSAVLDGRSTILDLDFYPRLRLPLPIIELYGMVPIGYSNLSLPGGGSEDGWNVGVAGGVGLTLIAVLKLIAQVGYTARFLKNDDTSELNLNLGVALGF